MAEAIHRIDSWAGARESRVVCICNVHSVVSGLDDADFRRIIDEADMATPDGWLWRGCCAGSAWPGSRASAGPT